MRGMDYLLALRTRGVKPACGVHIATDDADADWPRIAVKTFARFGAMPSAAEVYIGHADHLGLLDLRPLVGLVVHVDGMVSARVKAVCRAAVQAGAVRAVGSVHIPRPHGEFATVEMAVYTAEGVSEWHA